MSTRRDYKAKGTWRKDKRGHKSGLMVFVILLIVVFVGFLFYIRQANQTAIAAQSSPNQAPSQQKRVLASPSTERPEPKYTFYRDLPNREVLIIPPRQTPTPVVPQQAKVEPQPKQPQKVEQQPQPAPKPDSTKIVLQSTNRSNRSTQTNAPAPAPALAPAPRQTAATAPAANTLRGAYVIQAGAFNKRVDADKVRARLALLGIKAWVEAGQIGDLRVHRVRIGPFRNTNEANATRRRLDDNNIPAITLKMN